MSIRRESSVQSFAGKNDLRSGVGIKGKLHPVRHSQPTVTEIANEQEARRKAKIAEID